MAVDRTEKEPRDEAGPEATGSVPKCRGTRGDGKPCESVVVGASGWCFAHDPDLEAERRQARLRGGVASSNVARLRRHLGPSLLGPVFDRLESALGELHSGELSPSQASAMASLSRSMVAVLEAGQLEERIDQLERRLSA